MTYGEMDKARERANKRKAREVSEYRIGRPTRLPKKADVRLGKQLALGDIEARRREWRGRANRLRFGAPRKRYLPIEDQTIRKLFRKDASDADIAKALYRYWGRVCTAEAIKSRRLKLKLRRRKGQRGEVVSKLTIPQVRAIRASAARSCDLAAKYGVTEGCIRAIRAFYSWAWLD